MKTFIKKTMILLFCLCLCVSSFLHVRADEDSEESDETIEITSTYYELTTEKEQTQKILFNRGWFKQDATQYNHDLAKLSLGLATSAFRPSKVVTPDKAADENLFRFLGEAGFTDLRSDDYDKNPSMYTVSTVMGHQQIGEGEDAFELIAVGVCGQGYMDEWESNFTIGGGEIPEGFSRAAQLVYDRVFGYIANYRLKGNIKVWMSGFSRAAAISNITSAWLSDSDFFSQEKVFAYTFATPMTTRGENPDRYKNIFNICGKMDPVTNVPFADWGYSRFGTTLYTPAQETDSDFAIKRLKANDIYKQITGIDFWSNTGMNTQLRVIMDYLLKICPNVDTYVLSLQNHLISLWEKHDAASIMGNLMEMAEDPILINESNRHEANMLLNYISYLMLDYVSRDSGFRRWNDSASLASNMAQTHTPELYISWVFSADRPQDLFNDSKSYTQLYIDGDVIVTLTRSDMVLERYDSREDIEPDSNRYINKIGDKTVVLIPGDNDCTIEVSAVSDETISMMEARYEVGRQAPEKAKIRYFELKEGESVKASFFFNGATHYSMVDSYTETADFAADEYIDTNRLITFERSNFANLSWRDLILVFFGFTLVFLVGIFMFFSVIVAWMRHRRLRKRGYIPKGVKFRPLPIFCMFLILQSFLFEEVYTFLYDADTSGFSVSKAIIALLSLIIAFYGYRRRKNRFHRLILIAVALLGAADNLMPVSIIAGTILHVSAYTFLAYNFFKEDNPDTGQYIIWALLAAAGVWFILTRPGHFGFLRALAVAYALSSTAMTVTAFPLHRRTFRGTFLLLLSGLFLINNQVYGTTFFSHILSLGTYYLAVVLLASSGSGMIRRRSVIESVVDDPDEEVQTAQ